MRKPVLVVFSVLAGLALLQGCETAKGVAKGGAQGAQGMGKGAVDGAKKDINNTGKHIKDGVAAVNKADKDFEAKYW